MRNRVLFSSMTLGWLLACSGPSAPADVAAPAAEAVPEPTPPAPDPIVPPGPGDIPARAQAIIGLAAPVNGVLITSRIDGSAVAQQWSLSSGGEAAFDAAVSAAVSAGFEASRSQRHSSAGLSRGRERLDVILSAGERDSTLSFMLEGQRASGTPVTPELVVEDVPEALRKLAPRDAPPVSVTVSPRYVLASYSAPTGADCLAPAKAALEADGWIYEQEPEENGTIFARGEDASVVVRFDDHAPPSCHLTLTPQ